MAVILIGWELGGGLGHLRELKPLADGLTARGHACVLAVQNLSAAASVFDADSVRLVQAPFDRGSGVPGFRARRYTDILLRFGWGDPSRLGPLLDAWTMLLDLSGAQLAIADHAPTFCLAASGRLPLLRVGTGFALPPAAGDDFPVLDASAEPLGSADDVLRVVNAVLERRGRAPLDRLPELAAGRDAEVPDVSVMRAILELDPYQNRAFETVSGPFHELPAPSETAAELDYFAYLRSDPQTLRALFAILHAAGLRGVAYLGPHGLALRDPLAQYDVDVLDQPADLRDVLPRVRAVLHHAGAGLAHDALAVGRPQLLIPNHLEQQLTAERLSALKVGTVLAGQQTESGVRGIVEAFFASDVLRKRAAAFAAELAWRDVEAPLRKTLALCESWLTS